MPSFRSIQFRTNTASFRSIQLWTNTASCYSGILCWKYRWI